MKKSLILFGIVLFSPSLAFTEETPSDAPANSTPTPVLAKLKRQSPAAENPKSNCSIYGGMFIPADAAVVLISEKPCRSLEGGRLGGVLLDTHYEVAYRGKRLLVEKSSIDLSEVDTSSLERLSDESREPYAKRATLLSIALRTAELERALKRLEALKKHGLGIINASIADTSEYTEGTDFSFEFINPSNNTIKYVWVSLIGYNSVQDPVRGRSGRGPSITVKGVGPIEPGAIASYEWKYAWLTDLVQSFKISEIKVQYMSGATRTIRPSSSVHLDPDTLATLKSVD
jgi:hypothetical protein